jgi:hypothetical protein
MTWVQDLSYQLRTTSIGSVLSGQFTAIAPNKNLIIKDVVSPLAGNWCFETGIYSRLQVYEAHPPIEQSSQGPGTALSLPTISVHLTYLKNPVNPCRIGGTF